MRMLAGFLCLAAVAAHVPTLRAQGQPAARKRALPTAKASSDKTAQTALAHLATLQQAQNDAVQSGDAPRTMETTRDLLAEAILLLAEVKLVEGDKTSVEQWSSQALALRETPAARLQWSSLLLRSGKPALAAKIVQPVTETEPANVAAWTTLASSLRTAGDEKGAVTAYERAAALDHDTSVAYALASCYLAVHRLPEAQSLFRQIFEASGNAAIWHVAAGDSYREARYLSEAIAELKQAIAIDPLALHAEFFLGLTYLQQNEWGPDSQSFEHLRKATLQAPKEYVSNFYLGALESTDGTDLDSSNRHLHIAAEADPTQPEVWLYLGLNANRQHDSSLAEQYLRKSIQLTGNDEPRNNYQVRRAYFALGRILIAQGKRPEGVALLERYKAAEQASVAASGSAIVATAKSEAGTDGGHDALPLPAGMMNSSPLASVAASSPALPVSTTRRPDLVESETGLRHLIASGFNDLGTAQARQHQYAPALASFQQAEPWEAPSPGLLRNLGVAAFRAENYDETSRALKAFFQADPSAANDARTRLILAYAEFSTGTFPAAASDFARAEKAAMADPRAAYAWAFSLAQTGQMLQANQIADTLVQQTLPVDQLSLLCNVYVMTENYEGSLGCFRKAYALDASLPLVHYQAGQALVRLERPQEALPELKQELALNPANAEVQYALAFALLQASQKQEAKALLTTLTANYPDQAQAQYQFGKLLLEEGQTASAVEHLERAEQADPRPDYIHYQLGTAYRKMNRGADAERELKLFREIKDKKREPAASAAR